MPKKTFLKKMLKFKKRKERCMVYLPVRKG